MLDAVGTDTESLAVCCVDAPPLERISCEPKRLKVLVVEDDASTSVMIERCLTHIAAFEPQIAVAGTLAAAKFALDADDFDIVLIDSEMLLHAASSCLLSLGRPWERCASLHLTGAGTAGMSPRTEDGAASACLAKDNISPKRLATAILTAIQDHARYCTQEALKAELSTHQGA